ncbi:zinc transporter ZntB [Parasphingopyxis algicola]|uniref:zinc transporter ZntB n=1 Tax=Parasphingopyxis algicola TaxID=2026624 RepID=UPI0015A03B3C|nr:zinc transporter ZntB [Parasphingopyxis algicola]QLC26620.1 zinc transporter ZntB [Parasphingopyxis algicola]
MTGTADNLTDRAPLEETEGLIFACSLDGAGGAKRIGWDGVESWTPEDAPLWLHVNGAADRVRDWLSGAGGLTEPTAGAMLSPESRPRVFHGAKGFVVILRGINLNPGSAVEDMVALRMWSDGRRLITVREEKLRTVRDLYERLIASDNGPRTIAELFVELVDRLTERIGSVVLEYDDRLDAIEAQADQGDPEDLRRQLGNLRQELVGLRRYLGPQREALNRMMAEAPDWIDERQKLTLRETTDRSQRHIEEIDAARERAIVLKDDVANRLNEQLNRNLYVLSIVAAIFLPLSFLTGLLGINVGGMPGVDDGDAFWITCAALAVLLIVELLIFRKLKWL